MLIRNCAGGIVFSNEKVFLIKNEKEEWTLPKGVIRENEASAEVAVRRVKEETGLDVKIISNAGRTNYEFYSVTRQMPVCNKVTWYIMDSADEKFKLEDSPKIIDGRFFEINEALEKITHNQEKSLISVCYQRYAESKRNVAFC